MKINANLSDPENSSGISLQPTKWNKKFFFFLMLSLISFYGLNGQKPGQPVTNPKIKDPSKVVQRGVNNATVQEVLPTTVRPDWIEIWNRPGLQGRMAKYAENIPNFTYPTTFANKRDISLKVSPNNLAYIAFKDEFGQESIFVGEHPNFGRDHPQEIKSIRVVLGFRTYVNFSGISTQIHNNDCKRAFGNIKVKVFERLANNELLTCPLVEKNGNRLSSTAREAYDPVTLFYKSPDHSAPGIVSHHVFNYDGITRPEITSWARPTNQNPYVGARFMVSHQALRENRIIVEIESDLGFSHKSSDLATDYSSSVKMQRPEKRQVPYTTAGTFFSVGDFTAQGNPDNNLGQASGVRFSISKTLRVHFNKEQTPPSR